MSDSMEIRKAATELRRIRKLLERIADALAPKDASE